MLKRIPQPAQDPAQLEGGNAETFYAVDGNALWVTTGDDLVKMDIGLGREVDRFRLDRIIKDDPGVAEGVAIGGGSVWVSRAVARGQIVRLNIATGKLEDVFDPFGLHPVINLAYGDDALWVADNAGIMRIDPRTGITTLGKDIKNNWNVAAGGGFGWTSDESKGIVYRVDQGGHAVTYPTGLGATHMSYTNGRLWVANQDVGTVTGIRRLHGEADHVRVRAPGVHSERRRRRPACCARQRQDVRGPHHGPHGKRGEILRLRL